MRSPPNAVIAFFLATGASLLTAPPLQANGEGIPATAEKSIKAMTEAAFSRTDFIGSWIDEHGECKDTLELNQMSLVISSSEITSGDITTEIDAYEKFKHHKPTTWRIWFRDPTNGAMRTEHNALDLILIKDTSKLIQVVFGHVGSRLKRCGEQSK